MSRLSAILAGVASLTRAGIGQNQTVEMPIANSLRRRRLRHRLEVLLHGRSVCILSAHHPAVTTPAAPRTVIQGLRRRARDGGLKPTRDEQHSSDSGPDAVFWPTPPCNRGA
ncbi:hypothetical protein L209DRAFT_215412 [Thermothelomyces heterothallicus CBS 203.75]